MTVGGHVISLAIALTACGGPPNERCATFSERVAKCAMNSEHFGPLPKADHDRVRDIAYDVCTGKSTEPAHLKWYGQVDKKADCAATTTGCTAFQECMDAIDKATPH